MTTPRHERMSSVDTAWLRMDAPGNPMMIVGVAATATPVAYADFRRMVEERFLRFDRFRQRPVADALGASWVDDDAFDLDAHLRVERLPGRAGRRELETLAGRLASRPLDARRPRWQLHFIPRYRSGSAWITRVHHCYADGIAMIRVLLSMTEQDPAFPGALRGEEAARGRRPRTRRAGGIDPLRLLDWAQQLSQPTGDILESALAEGARLIEGGIHRLFHPEQAASLALQAGGMAGEFVRVLSLSDDPDTPLRGRLDGRKRVAWADPILLHEVKVIGKALGCTVNDVLMATVAGVLGAHLRECGVDTDGLVLRASVPVNLRAPDQPLTLGNRFGLVFVDLPVGIRNPVERLFRMHDTMAALKGSLQPPMTLMALAIMGMLPGAVQAPAIDLLSRKGSLVASNVPGPQAPLYACGQLITEMYFWVPQSGTIGLGVSLLSYAGQVFFGLIADRRRIADPNAVVDRFGREFEQLLLAVTVGALATHVRRRPRRSGGHGPGRARRRSAAST